MSDKSSGASSGIGFVGLLTIVFIVLKLCKVISWSWLWVLSPLWIVAGITVLVLIGCLIYAVIDTKKENK